MISFSPITTFTTHKQMTKCKMTSTKLLITIHLTYHIARPLSKLLSFPVWLLRNYKKTKKRTYTYDSSTFFQGFLLPSSSIGDLILILQLLECKPFNNLLCGSRSSSLCKYDQATIVEWNQPKNEFDPSSQVDRVK